MCGLKKTLIDSNISEYADVYENLSFLSDEDSLKYSLDRESMLSSLEPLIKWGSGKSKLDCSSLSNGCRICGEGLWSCLFINGECNCKCFYCPSRQDEKCLPTTNSISFESADDYVAYLKFYGFKGCSISGGEPLLTPELTLSYISAVKKEFGDSMYVWMYTNGTLVTEEILIELKNAGLNEIRFDIGATGYNIDKMSLACGIIPVVTVEIPAIPEEYEQMTALLPVMKKMGLSHLNLHQLRLTPYNYDKLITHNYTYLHGEKVTVLESELTALKIIKYVKENNIDLPVNYCAFTYKNRYQGLGTRNLNSSFMLKPQEMMTDNGYIRTITAFGSKEDLKSFKKSLNDEQKKLIESFPSGQRLTVHPELIQFMDIYKFTFSICYSSARQLPAVSYSNPFKEFKLASGKTIVIERFKISADLDINNDIINKFIDTFVKNKNFEIDIPDEILNYEKTPQGLQEYF